MYHLETAANDPLFLAIHAMVDRIFEMWLVRRKITQSEVGRDTSKSPYKTTYRVKTASASRCTSDPFTLTWGNNRGRRYNGGAANRSGK